MALTIILLSILFSAFFSGMEIAFVSANKLKLELDKKQGTGMSKLLNFFTKNPSEFIAGMLVGNNLALVIYGIVMAEVLEPVIRNFVSNEGSILLIQTIISTLIILVVSEFLPKTLFRLNPNRLLKLFAFPVFIIYIILFPVTKFITFLSNLLLKLILKVNINDEARQIVFSKADINDLVEKLNSNSNDEEEIDKDVKLFQNALTFSEVKLRECMVPRTEIVAVDVNNTSIEDLKQLFIESGFSKILVYENNIDNIIGYVHNSSLFTNPDSIRDIIKKVIIAPETMPANKLLQEFSKENKSLAVVVDEFGGTAGIVTIEDIMEEIFGEIEDEYDNSDYVENVISDTEYVFSGRLEIDYLNEKYKLNIPESVEYETLAGYILYKYESIPKLNEIINIDNFSIKILDVSNTKINLVNLRVK